MTAPAIPGRSRLRPPPARTDAGELRARRPQAWSAANWRWFALVWLLALIVFALNDPGHMIFDTKLGVDINAASFFTRLWPLWNPLEWFGTLQNQYIGYAIPMGPFFLAGQLMRLPVWVIERLWLSLLVAVGFWGVTKLATALRIGSDSSRLLAGIMFALWPTFTIVIGSTSAAVLPGLLAPWAILPLVGLAAQQRRIAGACARSGVAVMLMGGVNAVSTITALVLPALFLLTHTRGRQRISVCLCWAAAVVAATAWWAVPLLLQGRYSFNFLPYVEQSAVTTKTMSVTTFLRGAGNWTAYLNLGAPWLSAGWTVVASRFVIAASAVAAAGGLYGLARRDMPERRWLCLSVGLASLAALAGYAGPLGGPLHGLVDNLLNGTLAPFRNVYKLEPVVAVAFALGIAHVLGRARSVTVGTSRRVLASIVLAPVVAVCLAGLSFPYITGQVLQPGSFTKVPGYWYTAAGYLASHSPHQTALVIPGDTHGLYLWGDPIDDPLEPLGTSPWAERSLVPYGGAGSQVFLTTAENAFESGQQVPGLTAYLQRAGIRYVVVRNDLSPGAIGYTTPQVVHQTLELSGFVRVASFGPAIGGNTTNPGGSPQVQAYLPHYPSVEIYEAADPALRASAPVVALPASSTALVNGGPDSLLQLEGQGVLGDQAAVIAGDPTSLRPALWAVTDGQRRQDTAFGLINANTSFTYTANETNPPGSALGGAGGPPRQILPVPAAGHQTVAVLSGAASVTASSYGSWLTYEPQYDPVNAFDGNSETAWAEGNPQTPVGQWIQITFDHQINVPDSIGIQLLNDSFTRSIANQLQVSTAAGQATSTVIPTNATQRIRVKPGPTRWLRITITGASNVVAGNPGAGFREVLIPGVRVTRYLQPAQVSSVPDASSVAFSFHQAAPAPAGQGNSSATVPIARAFTLPVPLRLQVTGTAVAQPSSALENLVGRLAPPTRSSLLVSASSTWGSLPEFGPDNLFSNTRTPWIAQSADPVISLNWRSFRRISTIVVQPAYGFAAAPTKIKVTSFYGTRAATIGIGGVATLSPPLDTDQMQLSFPGWSSASQPGAQSGQPVLGLAKLSIPALSRLRVTPPSPQTTFRLICGHGPAITLDGQTYPTAVTGTLGQLAGNLPVQVHLCTPGSAVSLGSGQHHLLASPGLFTMTDVALQSSAGSAAAPARSLRVLSWQQDSRSLSIGPGQATFVEVHQNENPGWEASLNGHSLTAVTLDGWQQGFVVPAGAGGTITMSFAPATLYHIGLALAGLALIALLAVAFGWRRWPAYVLPLAYIIEIAWSVQLKAGRAAALWVPLELLLVLAAAVAALAVVRFRGPPGPSARRAEALRRTQESVARSLAAASPVRIRHRAAGRSAVIQRWIGPVAIGILVLLIGGPVVLVVPVLAAIAAMRPRWLPVTALAAMLLAGFVAATAVNPTAIGEGTFGSTAQAFALVALAAALMPRVFTARAERDGWQPSRPLPGQGSRGRVPGAMPPRPALPPSQPARPQTQTQGAGQDGRAGRSERVGRASQAGPADVPPRPALMQEGTPRPGPLPRTPFAVADELSCYYDAPAEPCNVHIEVRVPGHLNEHALRQATRAALAEQPRALVRRAKRGWWQRSYAWEVTAEPDVDPLSLVAWADEDNLAHQRMRFLSAAPPLDSSPPVRLLLASGPGEDCLILNAHHAALDGISCLELVRGIARHYSHSGAPATPAAPVPANGARPATGPRQRARAGGARAGGLLPRPAARIAAEARPAEADQVGYGFRLITCERVPRLPHTGNEPHATVNDLLITALILAIGRWNASHGRSPGRIRITMPVNSREAGQAGAAGNLSRLTAITAQPPHASPSSSTRDDVRALVADVAAQTLATKAGSGPQVDPLSRALTAAWCPAAVKHRLLRLALRTAGPLICDTSLVTNLGIVADPLRFGPAAASHMWFSTSAHMPRGLSVGAITLGGRLHLCLRYRHALFSEPAAARFAETYSAALSDITSQGVEHDRQY
jgi:arabinofuranan 3-O-arabinosyltransferase